MTENPLRKIWSAGRPAFGARLAIPSWFAAEIIGRAGFDFVYVDQQHGLLDDGVVASMLEVLAHHTVPLLRVAHNDPHLIGQALDRGALGVIVPGVSTPEEAAAAAAACRYPPFGVRSFGPVRAAMVQGSRSIDALSSVLCIAMVETTEGMQHLDEIAATPGIDVLYIGPMDLSLGIGTPLPSGAFGPELAAAVTAIREAGERHGKIAGIGGLLSGEAARRYAADGFKMVTVTSDVEALKGGSVRELADAKGSW